MMPSLIDLLCTRCGLCCDGSLFADVELAGEREATPLEILGLDVEADGDGLVLLQPCAALRGRRCGVYPHRPGCCRTFECYLLQQVSSGAVGVDDALARVRDAHARIRQLKTWLGPAPRGAARIPLAERCAEALAGRAPAAPAERARRERLRRAMAALQDVLDGTFLGRPRRAGAATR